MSADWLDRAACKGYPTDWWFPAKGDATFNEGVAEARRICSTCPVRSDCLDYAVQHREGYGLWGGLFVRERRKLHKNNLRVWRCRDCGKHGQSPRLRVFCDDCRARRRLDTHLEMQRRYRADARARRKQEAS